MATATDEAFTQLAVKAGPEESLKSYRLLDALRGGDPAVILPLLPPDTALAHTAGLSTAKRASTAPLVSETGYQATVPTQEAGNTSTALHLAVRCAKYPTVELVLKHSPSALNAQDSKGQTPVHIAAALNRCDVLALFLGTDGVDDTLKDANGKTCLELVTGSEAAGLITLSRADFNQAYLVLLATYVASPLPDGQSPASAAPSSRLSINLTSPKLAQVPLPLHSSSHSPILPGSGGGGGGHHRTASESPAGKPVSAASGHVSNLAAEKLYHFLSKPRSRCIDFSAKDGTSGTTVLHEAARRKDLAIIKLVIAKGGDVLARDRKGKLAVDVAKDERVRSVLRHAATSEGRALKAAANDGGAPPPLFGPPPAMKGYLSKWTNMARGYRSRWFVLDKGVLSYYRSQEDEGRASRGSINMAVARVSAGSDGLKFEVTNKLGKSYPGFFLKGNHPVEVMRWLETLRLNMEWARDANAVTKTQSGTSSYAGSITPTDDRRRSSTSIMNTSANSSGVSADPSRRSSPAGSFGDREDSIMGDDDTFSGDNEGMAPHHDDFDLLANSTKAQLELTQQLLDSLVVGRDEPSPSSPADDRGRPSSMHSTTSRQADVKDALKGSLASLSSMLDEYVDVVAQRERYFIRKYEREIDVKRLWEENMKELAAQHAAMEIELHKVGRDNTRRKRALQEVRATLSTSSPGATSPLVGSVSSSAVADDTIALPEDGSGILPPPLRATSSNGTFRVSSERARRPTSGSLSPNRAARLRSATMQTLAPYELEQIVDSALMGEGEDESEDDDDEEFFEAIESGTIPITQEVTQLTRYVEAETYAAKMDMEPYKGYEHLRTKLPIDNDNRPPVSLWAILKGSIGKDLTKISFPVFFNEPTSMLQRMAEDVEFSECLDAAAVEEDPTKRIAFVAAYAMSNYSSTIGRIAKPFNPMLGETFEYVDLNKKYRYISEQVCHHPPISACIAQSPSWEYYGEVDAKSKFLGKSFEIRPTGIAHVKLRLPKAWAPDAPPTPRIPDMVLEHYSWTKVTTSVSNFLFGNPIIDHYGDMVITNHRTGDTCTLTFKPRGWRGSGACEIKGKVIDKDGNERWDIAGKWSSQLVARRFGAGFGDLAPDANVPTTQAGDVAPEYIRLWKNSYKPPGMPFNLTPFAITLNDTNPELKKWLPPTDCRLRPDQHAFESGQFERANQLKSDLEDHQRETRKRRETGQLPPHKARWFSRKRDPDTGENFWDPALGDDGNYEYWEERDRVGKAKQAGVKAVWKDVDPIFADF